MTIMVFLNGQQENGYQIDDQSALNQVGDYRFHRRCSFVSA